jgi:hypothetical protein
MMPKLLLFLQGAAVMTTAQRQLTLVELGVMVALVAQTGMFFYWGGQIKKGLTQLEQRHDEMRRALTDIERNGTPIARTAAVAVEKEYGSIEALRLRLENHIAALGTTLVRVENVERRMGDVEQRCDQLHPPAPVQRLLP